jgi:hypothetical protein
LRACADSAADARHNATDATIVSLQVRISDNVSGAEGGREH